MNEISFEDLKEPLVKFLEKKVKPNTFIDDENGTFRREYFEELGNLGLTGISTPEEFGGAGLSFEIYTRVIEEIAKISTSLAVTVAVNGLPQTIINEFGNLEQKKKYIPDLALGKKLGSFCLSEPDSGSDAKALKTTAKFDGKNFILNGSKMWVSNGGSSDIYMVMAKEDEKSISCFVVEKNTKGVSFGKPENKMGLRSSLTCSMLLDSVVIPASNRIGEKGQGFKIALTALNSGRITIAATGLGLARAAFNEAVSYMKIREQFGKKLFEFQGLQFKIAEMATDIECSHAMIEKAARLRDQNKNYIHAAAMAKLKSTDTCMFVTTEAVQIHGGYGYTKEYPVERFMRDAKVLQIVEGTNEIQKTVIAKEYFL